MLKFKDIDCNIFWVYGNSIGWILGKFKKRKFIKFLNVLNYSEVFKICIYDCMFMWWFFFLECLDNFVLLIFFSFFICNIFSYCLGVECCILSLVLGRSFYIYLEIDFCILKIVVGIDKWKFEEIFFEIDKLLLICMYSKFKICMSMLNFIMFMKNCLVVNVLYIFNLIFFFY